MIYSLFGKIVEKTASEVVIECGGVGYLAKAPIPTLASLPAVGSEALLYTHMNVSDNDVSLFGFASSQEREMFLTLTKVSGVGPKAGLSILSALNPGQVALAVSAGDAKAFTSASGVGNKLAQRIVLELKDKVGLPASGGLTLEDIGQGTAIVGGMQQAAAALMALGYSQSEAASAVSGIDTALPTSEIIRIALQGIGGGR